MTGIPDEIDVLIRARYPILYLVTWEEDRAEEILAAIAKGRGKRCFLWSVTLGLVEAGAAQKPSSQTRDPLAGLQGVIETVDPSLFVFRDFHPFLNDTAVVRKMREIAAALKSSYKTLVIVSPRLVVPTELEKDITVIDLPLPSPSDLDALVGRVSDEVKANREIRVDLGGETRPALVRAMMGLTRKEAENVLAKALVRDGALGAESIPLVISEKEQIIRKSGLLEYYPTDHGFTNVGGLGALKEWLRKRGRAFSDEARAFGLAAPRGLLMVGIQGCGKSLTAKAVAGEWRVPLLRMDVGRVFSSLVGSSEENLRRAIRVAESVAPCVLWIDEVEKAFAGSESSATSDAGTSSRVLATFLTWLQEKTAPVFVVATANGIERLPPEFLRKGRFDEIFFVDLPAPAERREIFSIHIWRNGRDYRNFDLDALAQCAEGFSGAEIEAAVAAALFDAFDQGSELSTELIKAAVAATVPLSRTAAQAIEGVRRWADGRARGATTPAASAPAGSGRALEL